MANESIVATCYCPALLLSPSSLASLELPGGVAPNIRPLFFLQDPSHGDEARVAAVSILSGLNGLGAAHNLHPYFHLLQDPLHGDEARVAAVSILSGLARGGCGILWADGALMFDEAVRVATAAMMLEDCPVSV